MESNQFHNPNTTATSTSTTTSQYFLHCFLNNDFYWCQIQIKSIKGRCWQLALPGVVIGDVQGLCVQQESTPGEEAVLGQHAHPWETYALLQGEVDRHFLGVHYAAILGYPRQQRPAQQWTKGAEDGRPAFSFICLLDYLFLFICNLLL